MISSLKFSTARIAARQALEVRDVRPRRRRWHDPQHPLPDGFAGASSGGHDPHDRGVIEIAAATEITIIASCSRPTDSRHHRHRPFASTTRAPADILEKSRSLPLLPGNSELQLAVVLEDKSRVILRSIKSARNHRELNARQPPGLGNLNYSPRVRNPQNTGNNRRQPTRGQLTHERIRSVHLPSAADLASEIITDFVMTSTELRRLFAGCAPRIFALPGEARGPGL